MMGYWYRLDLLHYEPSTTLTDGLRETWNYEMLNVVENVKQAANMVRGLAEDKKDESIHQS